MPTPNTPPNAPGCPSLPPAAPDSCDRRNKASLLASAAAGAADALLDSSLDGLIRTFSHPARTPATPRSAPQRPATPPDAPCSANRKNKPNSLSHVQLAAIRFLVAGRKVMWIARELQIDKKTLYRWRLNADFNAELRKMHDRLCLDTPRAQLR